MNPTSQKFLSSFYEPYCVSSNWSQTDPMRQAVRVPQQLSSQRILAQLRSQMPVQEYLGMLHTLAMTGQVPIFDPPAAPNLPPTRTGQFTPPDRQLQHKTLTFLVDKAFAPLEKPAASRLAQDAEREDEVRSLTSHADARNLTVGELLRRLTAQLPQPQDPAPDAQDPEPVQSGPAVSRIA